MRKLYETNIALPMTIKVPGLNVEVMKIQLGISSNDDKLLVKYLTRVEEFYAYWCSFDFKSNHQQLDTIERHSGHNLCRPVDYKKEREFLDYINEQQIDYDFLGVINTVENHVAEAIRANMFDLKLHEVSFCRKTRRIVVSDEPVSLPW